MATTLKKLEAMVQWLLMAIVLFQTISRGPAQACSSPISIAASHHPLATADNNGRRMVRDGQDRRDVVYQDLRGDRPIICFVHSGDGKVWSQPDTLFEGAFPSLAIDRSDRLFLVWQAADASGIYFT